MNDNFKFINEKEFIIGDKMDDKLTILCKLHVGGFSFCSVLFLDLNMIFYIVFFFKDEICEIAKTLNQMFSFQMLIMMAYGFMSVTAQFYFLYCGLMEQVKFPLMKNSKDEIL